MRINEDPKQPKINKQKTNKFIQKKKKEMGSVFPLLESRWACDYNRSGTIRLLGYSHKKAIHFMTGALGTLTLGNESP